MERGGEFAAASLQTESYLEREHNVRRAVLGVGYATSGITANVYPPNILARDQLNPYLQAARRKEVEQWQSGRIDPSYGSATPSCSGGMSNQKSGSRKLSMRSVNIATGLRLPKNPSSTQVASD